jgi:hypothetical protein
MSARWGRFVLIIGGCLAAGLAGGCSSVDLDVIDVNPDHLRDGLLAHWRFDDGAGSLLAADSSGMERNGTITNGTFITHDQFGGALHLAAGEVAVPSFPQPTNNWSVAGWVRPPVNTDFGDTYLTLISTELILAGGWQMNIRLTAPTASALGSLYQFAYWIGPALGDYFYFNCECVDVGQWTHLAAVVDVTGGMLSFYKNGTLFGQRAAPAGTTMLPKINTGSPTLYLARWPPDSERDLTGDLDDFVVYDRALAPREVQYLARTGVPPDF